MNEWDMLGVIIALVGFLAVVIPPIVRLNVSITRNTAATEQLTREFRTQTEDNRAAHERLWHHNEQQDRQILDHEVKIAALKQS